MEYKDLDRHFTLKKDFYYKSFFHNVKRIPRKFKKKWKHVYSEMSWLEVENFLWYVQGLENPNFNRFLIKKICTPLTLDRFDDKWKDYLEEGHYGMTFEDLNILSYLDKEFEKEIKVNPNFSFSQIKSKFGSSRVYATSENTNKWENEINKMMK